MTGSYSSAIQENHPQNGPDIIRARILRGKRSAKHLADWIRDYSQLQAKQATELESFLKQHALRDSALGTLSHPWQSIEQSLTQTAITSNRCAKRLNSEVEQPLRDAEKWNSADRTLALLANTNSQLSTPQIDEFEQIDLTRLESMKLALLALSGVESDRIQQQLTGCEAVMKAWSSFEPVEDIGSFSAQIVSGVAELVPATHATSVGGNSGNHSGNHNASSRNASNSTSLSEALAKPPAINHSGENSNGSSVNSRSSSQATVRRRTSFLLRNKHDDDGTESHSVLSKVGSIFGRKKNKKKAGSNLASVPDSDNGNNNNNGNNSARFTKPADFGLARRNSSASYQSSTNSQFSGLPHPRSRPNDESMPNSPFRTAATGPIDHANLPKLIDREPSTPRQYSTNSSNPMNSMPLNSTGTGDSMPMNPLVPTKIGSAANSSTGSPLRSPVNPASPVFRSHLPATTSPLAMNSMPPMSPPSLPIANTGQSIQSSVETSSLYTTSGDAPAPPPARQGSVHYPHAPNHASSNSSNSINALASNNTGGSGSSPAPVPRTTSLAPNQRQQRVASHLFTNLNPARESNRDSIIPTNFSGNNLSGSAFSGNNFSGTNLSEDYSAHPSQQQQQQQQQSIQPVQPTAVSEASDELRSLRSHSNPNAAIVSQTPGSPDQFWTPAQRFPKQFQDTKPFTNSVTSLSSPQPTEFPTIPENDGLVAVSVESVDAEYKGETLVRSSVSGHALAVVHGANPPATMPVGTLLADASAKLTPCPLLKQITDLSFELPTASYKNLQELCTYNIESAVANVPIKLTPLWRIEDKTVRLVLTYQLNDLYVGGDKAVIENLVISVRISGPTRAISAQSKPVATFSREKQRVTWRLPQKQTLTRGVVAGKLLCQCSTEEPGAEPGPIELHARVLDVENSLLQLRTLSSGNEWVSVPANVAADVTIHQV